MHKKVGKEINDCVKDGIQMLTPAKMNQPIEITLCGLTKQMYTFVQIT